MINVKAKIHHAFVSFADGTTMHGVKDLKDASNITARILWALAMFCSVIFFAYQTKSLIESYLEEKTAVSIDTITDYAGKNWSIVYCNDNWIDVRYFSKTKKSYHKNEAN